MSQSLRWAAQSLVPLLSLNAGIREVRAAGCILAARLSLSCAVLHHTEPPTCLCCDCSELAPKLERAAQLSTRQQTGSEGREGVERGTGRQEKQERSDPHAQERCRPRRSRPANRIFLSLAGAVATAWIDGVAGV